MLYFTIQNRLQAGTSQVSEAAGARWRFCGRISSDYRRIVFLLAEAFREFPLKSWASRFRGRRSIWWGWRVTLLAPRIGNDVSYVTQIRDDIHFAWQAQYLLRLPGDFSWQAQHFVTFSEIATTRNVVFYNTKSSPSWDESGLRSGGCEMTILWSDIVGYRRIIVESSFYWRKHSGSFRWNLELQDFVAGAVFGEVGGWLDLLHALEMTFHMWRRSGMTFILRGRRSIWWGCRVTFRDRRSTSWHFGR